MDKKRFSGIAAAVVLIILQSAFLVAIAAKALVHFLRIVLDPHIRRGDVFSKFFKSLVLIGMAWFFFFGLHIYNELTDIEHFLQVAHGRLLVEMQRKEVVLSGCGNAVAMYATMEEKIQDRLIALHSLTQMHGPRGQIVESEGLESDYYEGEEIDLTSFVQDQILLTLPQKAVCREECRGLCSDCRKNLNREVCQCSTALIDPRFQALKNLKVQ